jgi:hypothetical protein
MHSQRNWEQKHNSGTECKERETMYILGLDILYIYFSILTFESCSWRDVLYSTLCDKVCPRIQILTIKDTHINQLIPRTPQQINPPPEEHAKSGERREGYGAWGQPCFR